MTLTDMQIAIASANGWKYKDSSMTYFGASVPAKMWHDPQGKSQNFVPPLNLDTMRVWRDAMDPKLRVKYLGHLYGIVDTSGERSVPAMFRDDWKIHNASVEQCAEAYLRAIGKFKEPKDSHA